MKHALAVCLALWAPQADAACRQALALGLDVSGSVDGREFRLQMDGLAAALLHPEVREALLAMPSAPVALAVYDWSGPKDQRRILDWIEIASVQVLQDVAEAVREARRVDGDRSTAIGSAMQFGAAMLTQRTACWKRTLDLTGDGKSNTGPRPQDVRAALSTGLTVNALVIGLPTRRGQASPGLGELSSYFRAYVLSGPDAFVETALGFEDFEAAMVRKLKRELQGQVFSLR